MEGGWVCNGLGAVTPCPGTSILCPEVGTRAPLSPRHVPPIPAELRHRASPWQRNLGYPLAMLGLLALTVSGPGLPGELELVTIPPSSPHPLPAPPRASPCSSSASMSWSCCWTMPRCRGASRYPGRGWGTARGSVPHQPGDRCPPNTPPPPPAGHVPGPDLLLHLRVLWSCPAGCPHLVSFRGTLMSPALSPVSPALPPRAVPHRSP